MKNTYSKAKEFVMEHKLVMAGVIVVAIIVPLGIPTISAVFGKDVIKKSIKKKES